MTATIGLTTTIFIRYINTEIPTVEVSITFTPNNHTLDTNTSTPNTEKSKRDYTKINFTTLSLTYDHFIVSSTKAEKGLAI